LASLCRLGSAKSLGQKSRLGPSKIKLPFKAILLARNSPMLHLYVIRVQWQHEEQSVVGCILVQASSAENALKKSRDLLPNRIPQGKNIELASKVEKAPDNCFVVCGKEPVLPKIITPVGASF
jgi:hypothetical protein